MQKGLWLTVCGIAMAGVACGQLKKQFTVENSQTCDKVNLHLKTNTGECFIKAGPNSEILNVFSNQDQSSYAHQYRKEIINRTCQVYLNFENMNAAGLGQTISTRMFGEDRSGDNKIWKMYLTDAKPYNLELEYGMGNAHVDLSGLAIERLKINTGSADVNIGYSSLENKVEMDTLSVKVDLGSLRVYNLNLSRTHYTSADVGFGNLTLDFSSNPPLVPNRIEGSVGAGNLVIILPSSQTPVLVTINDSWLCSVKIPESLKKIRENTFANAAYSKHQTNALVFNLDVSMGNIIFKQPGTGN
ncbi:MAG TPA: hypothetical protein VFI14_05820 [Chryseosolibacter sp.]|nr:hypothetical protein [Chryseosolibacter sp.]